MMISILRSAFFLSSLLLLWTWERWHPRGVHTKIQLKNRFVNNLALGALNVLVLNLFFLGGLFGLATYVQQRSLGLLNITDTDLIYNIITSFIVLDFIVYFQHWLFHKVDLLWRIHRVHHLDTFLDATTGIRFHPLEILFSFLIKACVVLTLGVNPLGIVIFEIVLSWSSLFTHANIYISPQKDRIIRKLIVTPDMHRIHHSIKPEELSCNFSFNFSFWDHLFRTYKARPAVDYTLMPIGLSGQHNQAKNKGLISLLISPFS